MESCSEIKPEKLVIIASIMQTVWNLKYFPTIYIFMKVSLHSFENLKIITAAFGMKLLVFVTEFAKIWAAEKKNFHTVMQMFAWLWQKASEVVVNKIFQ